MSDYYSSYFTVWTFSEVFEGVHFLWPKQSNHTYIYTHTHNHHTLMHTWTKNTPEVSWGTLRTNESVAPPFSSIVDEWICRSLSCVFMPIFVVCLLTFMRCVYDINNDNYYWYITTMIISHYYYNNYRIFVLSLFLFSHLCTYKHFLYIFMPLYIFVSTTPNVYIVYSDFILRVFVPETIYHYHCAMILTVKVILTHTHGSHSHTPYIYIYKLITILYILFTSIIFHNIIYI